MSTLVRSCSRPDSTIPDLRRLRSSTGSTTLLLTSKSLELLQNLAVSRCVSISSKVSLSLSHVPVDGNFNEFQHLLSFKSVNQNVVVSVVASTNVKVVLVTRPIAGWWLLMPRPSSSPTSPTTARPLMLTSGWARATDRDLR